MLIKIHVFIFMFHFMSYHTYQILFLLTAFYSRLEQTVKKANKIKTATNKVKTTVIKMKP